ncbi:MAG: hypothetical protein M1294_09690 [Firmicutes bacterium]|jgi:hypothetical protein|nr:hypothetical protein [Bacillota bacterium]MCL5015223.1 hypothetical protein [Bacillota bacterium]
MNTMAAALLLGIFASIGKSHHLRLDNLFWIGIGLLPSWLLEPHVSTGLLLGGIILSGALGQWRPPLSRKMIRKKRWEIVKFWRTMAFFLSAGMTFWQAVDQAVSTVPEVGPDIGNLARLVGTEHSDSLSFSQFRALYPGPEADLVATMMVYGYQNGLQADDAVTQAWDMEEQLALEDALKRQSDPLLLTILPALLLVNVLVMFVAPMGLLAMRNLLVVGR